MQIDEDDIQEHDNPNEGKDVGRVGVAAGTYQGNNETATQYAKSPTKFQIQ
jgi:hypothetical protein